jgi:hypothetical protein
MHIPLPLQSYRHRALPVSAQRLINLYAEQQPPAAAAPAVLLSTPGLRPWVTLDDSPIRGLHVMGELLFAVAGSTVWQVRNNGSVLNVGSVTPGEAPVMMSDNGAQLVIVTDPDAYVCDGMTVSQITSPAFPGASTVDYLDGYHIFTAPLSGEFFISALLDATTYDALDFASAESSPDPLVRVMVDHREVWLLGKHSVEIWTNTGAADFPFARQPGAVLEVGCAAAGSVAKLDNSVYWLATDGIVYRAQGYQPQRVSTHPLEQAWGALSSVRDAQALTYTQDGHGFYVLTFPGLGTWAFDAATQQWHERTSWQRTTWRAASVAQAYGRLLAGDRASGAILELDPATYTEDGQTHVRQADFPPLSSEGKRIALGRVELELETGVGLTTGQGSDPQCMLSWSDDGGRTWSNEHWRSMGQVGQFRHRVRWYRLGQFRHRVLRVAVSDPVPVTIISASAELRPGMP